MRPQQELEAIATNGTGLVLLTRALAQFLMTLDSSVMKVSIATVAQDVGTTVTGIQTAITLYTLVMAHVAPPASGTLSQEQKVSST
jgi:predicted MFS family arabinose efflux permease